MILQQDRFQFMKHRKQRKMPTNIHRQQHPVRPLINNRLKIIFMIIFCQLVHHHLQIQLTQKVHYVQLNNNEREKYQYSTVFHLFSVSENYNAQKRLSLFTFTHFLFFFFFFFALLRQICYSVFLIQTKQNTRDLHLSCLYYIILEIK